MGNAVEKDGAADDVWVGTELRPPEGVTENGHVLLAGLVLALGEVSAKGGAHPEDVEIVYGDLRPAQLDGFVDTGEGDGAAGSGGHELEDGILLLPVEIVEGGDAVPASSGRLFENLHDAVGVGVGQGLEQGAIDEAEDGGGAADADSHGGDGDHGEGGRFEQGPEPISHILEEFVHVLSPAGAQKVYTIGKAKGSEDAPIFSAGQPAPGSRGREGLPWSAEEKPDGTGGDSRNTGRRTIFLQELMSTLRSRLRFQ